VRRCCAVTRRRASRLLLLLLLLHAYCIAVIIIVAAGAIVRARSSQLQAGSNLVKQALRQQPCCLGAMQHLAIVTRNLTAAEGCSKPAAARANGDTQ
jgi:hypothetical protein